MPAAGIFCVSFITKPTARVPYRVSYSGDRVGARALTVVESLACFRRLCLNAILGVKFAEGAIC